MSLPNYKSILHDLVTCLFSQWKTSKLQHKIALNSCREFKFLVDKLKLESRGVLKYAGIAENVFLSWIIVNLNAYK